MSDPPIRGSHWLTIIGKWWIGLVASFLVLGTTIAIIITVFRWLNGNPEWEGIVMIPEVLIFAMLLSSPGIALFLLGRLLARSRRDA